MENMRTLAFQVPDDLFNRIKEYLHRNNLTQRQFVIGLIETELDREQAEREDVEEEQEIISEEDEENVHFVINNPEDDPAVEYGADEDAFGGELDGDVKYEIDEVTGEIIGANQPKEIPYMFPPVELLKQGSTSYAVSQEEIAKNTRILSDTLESFRIRTRGDIACSCADSRHTQSEHLYKI